MKTIFSLRNFIFLSLILSLQLISCERRLINIQNEKEALLEGNWFSQRARYSLPTPYLIADRLEFKPDKTFKAFEVDSLIYEGRYVYGFTEVAPKDTSFNEILLTVYLSNGDLLEYEVRLLSEDSLQIVPYETRDTDDLFSYKKF